MPELVGELVLGAAPPGGGESRRLRKKGVFARDLNLKSTPIALRIGLIEFVAVESGTDRTSGAVEFLSEEPTGIGDRMHHEIPPDRGAAETRGKQEARRPDAVSGDDPPRRLLLMLEAGVITVDDADGAPRRSQDTGGGGALADLHSCRDRGGEIGERCRGLGSDRAADEART